MISEDNLVEQQQQLQPQQHNMAVPLDDFQNGDEDMVVIAADDNVDLTHLQQMIASGNVVISQTEMEGTSFDDSQMEGAQVIHLTDEQTNLFNSGVPLEEILNMSGYALTSSTAGGADINGNNGLLDPNTLGNGTMLGAPSSSMIGAPNMGIGQQGAGNPNGVLYHCPSCPTHYVNANAFTKHMREKHFVKVYTCRQCEEFFDTLSGLFLHARRTHVDPRRPRRNPTNYKFHCDMCNYMTNNGGTMEHHKRAHTGERPYKCDICDKRFAQKANMKTHRNRHMHKDRIFKCDTCSKAFASHDIYLAHLRTREHELREHYALISSNNLELECLGCRQVFETVYNLNKHTRNCRHLRSVSIKFRCNTCDVLVTDVTALKKHVKEHEGVTSIGCPVCGERGFPGFNQLNHHITRAHALKVNRRHVCRYCESTYESKKDLDMHVRQMHADERNARASRGAVGRLKCDFEACEFTTNSVMLMDRHHSQHKQLEEEGLDPNQCVLPPARNESKGPRRPNAKNEYTEYDEEINEVMLFDKQQMTPMMGTERILNDEDFDAIDAILPSMMGEDGTGIVSEFGASLVNVPIGKIESGHALSEFEDDEDEEDHEVNGLLLKPQTPRSTKRGPKKEKSIVIPPVIEKQPVATTTPTPLSPPSRVKEPDNYDHLTEVSTLLRGKKRIDNDKPITKKSLIRSKAITPTWAAQSRTGRRRRMPNWYADYDTSEINGGKIPAIYNNDHGEEEDGKNQGFENDDDLYIEQEEEDEEQLDELEEGEINNEDVKRKITYTGSKGRKRIKNTLSSSTTSHVKVKKENIVQIHAADIDYTEDPYITTLLNGPHELFDPFVVLENELFEIGEQVRIQIEMGQEVILDEPDDCLLE